MINKILKNTVFRDTILITIASLSSKFIGFVLLPVYTHALTPTQFGLGDLIFSISSLLVPLVSLSSFDAIFRYMLKDDNVIDKKSLVSSVTFISIVGSTLLFVIVSFINLNNINGLKIWLCISVVMGIFNSLLQAYTKGTRQNKYLASSGILGSIVTAISAVVTLKLFDLSLNGYFLTLCIGTFCSNFYLFFRTGITKELSYKYVNVTTLKKTLVYSMPLIPNAISWWITSDISRLFIYSLIGSFGNGMFAVASKIPSLLNMFFGIFNQAWQITAITKIDGDETGTEYLLSSIYRTMQFTFVMAGLLVILIPEIYQIIAPMTYFSSWKIVPPLLFGAIMSMVAGQMGTYFLTKEKTKIILITTIIGMILNMVLGYLLTLSLGLFGSAITSGISFLIVSVLRFILLIKMENRILKLNIPWIAVLLFVFSLFIVYSLDFSWILLIVYLFLVILYYIYIFKPLIFKKK